MWLAQGSASESTKALITAKVATSPWHGASGFHRVGGPEKLVEPPEAMVNGEVVRLPVVEAKALLDELA